RAARPTARAALVAFDGLCATYTPTGLVLDRLSKTQRIILALLEISLPWPETPTAHTGELTQNQCGKRG
ncbi:MAG: hypothetical protein ACR2F6_00250, partial [Mycobacteriales bacterium]